MSVILLSRDLMVISRVAGAAENLHAHFVAVNEVSEVIEACRFQVGSLLLLDLRFGNLDIREFIDSLTQPVDTETKVIAFGPHVQEKRLEEARSAGCHKVVTRGQLDREVDQWLAEYVESVTG